MRQLGTAQALLSGFCFGFLGVLGKWAFELGLTPGEFLAFRFLIAAGLLGLWLAWRNPHQLKLERPVLLRCVALGVLGYAVFSSFFFSALSGLSVSLTVLLLYTYPALVTLGAWCFFGERLKGLELAALPLALLGIALLVGGELSVRSPLALAAGLLASLFYSAYILASSRWLKGQPPLVATFYIMLSAGLALGFAHIRGLPSQPSAWLVLGATALVGTLAAMGLFLASLQKLKSGEVALLSTAEPVTGIFLAAILLGERMQAAQWLGAFAVIAGMILVSLAQRRVP